MTPQEKQSWDEAAELAGLSCHHPVTRRPPVIQAPRPEPPALLDPLAERVNKGLDRLIARIDKIPEPSRSISWTEILVIGLLFAIFLKLLV